VPRYYFHLCDKRWLTDAYGTVLPDNDAALTHALLVAAELMLNSSGIFGNRWSAWTMLVNDKNGERILALPLAEVPEGTTRH
jgi:hypothetical protein